MPNRRAADQGGLAGWAHKMYARYGAIISLTYGITLVMLAVALLAVTFSQRSIAQDTHNSSRGLCVRSREFSPYLARDLALRHVFPPKVQGDYERTIPTRCP